MNKFYLKAILAAALTLSCGVACQSVNSTERAYPHAQPQRVRDHRVITDGILNAHAHIISVYESQTPTGLLQIQVQVTNKTNTPWEFRYTFEWYDAQGMLLPTTTPSLTHKRILGGEKVSLQAVATDPNAKDFRFKITGY